MSISPFKSGDKTRSQQPKVKKKPDDQPLTLSQALTITAGMAGLIGLISGVFIRFSLAHSSNTRFLSPLQTFPTLSSWASDAPLSSPDPDTSESNASELDVDSLTPSVDSSSFDDSQGRIDYSGSSYSDTDYPAGFDEFANRSSSAQSTQDSAQDPLEVLRSGPLLRESGNLDSDGIDAIMPELEDPAFEPYFAPESETERFYQ
jgi:hypothetical protein